MLDYVDIPIPGQYRHVKRVRADSAEGRAELARRQPGTSTDCTYLGPEIRNADGVRVLVECPQCPKLLGQPNKKTLHTCRHPENANGQCTKNGKADGVWSCTADGGCKFKTTERGPIAVPYGRPVVRNLVYHVGPFKGNGVWQRNVAQLRKRIDLFNGRRIVAIVTAPNMDDPDLVRKAFGGTVDDFIVLPNRPSLREVVTALPMLERIQSLAPHECTFYAQTKGVTRPVNDGVTVHRWADIMYETCLDYWPLVEDLLLDHPCAGSFKKVGAGFKGSKSSWHYSGSFFWMRNAAFFSRGWRTMDQQWDGIEAWPGLHVAPAEAGCIYHEGAVATLNMYSMEYLKHSVERDYQCWQERNEVNRTVTHAV